ncbi:hypothetical protein EJ05DRAFT_459908, partial [Pseudovirgaria hyperparasitica]
ALLGLALTVTSVQALDFGSFGGQVVINEELSVPGENPLEFCADPKDYKLEIDKVDLSPNPPKPGQTLSIKANGTVKEKIEAGAKVHLQVKYGLITLINQEADLCDNLEKVDKECPLEKGELTFSRDVDLPKQIPPGKYTVLADVFNEDKETITCLTAHVQFP